MSFFKAHKEIVLGLSGASILILFSILLSYTISPELTFLERMAFMQVSFGMGAFSIIFVTLLITLSRFDKAMAKPLLSLSFSEKGETEATLDTHHNMDSVQTFDLWVLNTGNKVANVLQVELDIPEDFNPNFRHILEETRPIPHRFSIKGETRTVSFYAIDKYYFVGVPSRVIAFELETHSEYEYPSPFTIPYRVFGDWGDTQKGELEVTCIKQ